MPLPLAPVAGFALRYGTLAVLAWGVKRSLRPGRTDQRAEDALDEADDGLAVHRPRDRGQTNATGRFRRTFRWGSRAVEVDAAAMARIRIRKV
ncbi:MAG: hypothetical protein R3D84_01255 [Paracoccaceae bacterium]